VCECVQPQHEEGLPRLPTSSFDSFAISRSYNSYEGHLRVKIDKGTEGIQNKEVKMETRKRSRKRRAAEENPLRSATFVLKNLKKFWCLRWNRHW
jgi:hypothetical protein